MKRVLILAVALAGFAGAAVAGDSDYQEGSSSRDYGYVGYAPRGYDGAGYGYRGYGYSDYGYSNYGYPNSGSYRPSYSYSDGYSGDGYGYRDGYGYGPSAYDGGRSRYRHTRRQRCGCRYRYYDDDYR